MITIEEINDAHDRIRPYIHRTSILTNQTINNLTEASVYFKCENFQKTGSFKARGGLNAVLQAVRQYSPPSFCTHSSGNHAQAIAYASRQFNIPSYIVMPRTAPQVKKDAVRAYGGEIIECEPNQKSREEGVANVQTKNSSFLIHPFDNDMVITGQATAAKELIEDFHGNFDYILTPIGGGGLISGTALTVHNLAPNTIVFGAEPDGAADAIESFKTGNIIKLPSPSSMADGLLSSLSERTLKIIKANVEDILTVSENEIKNAMTLIWERLKIVIEPSSAVPLAAVIKRKELFTNKTVGIIISGGNVDITRLPF
jgi:threonine dehydratase